MHKVFISYNHGNDRAYKNALLDFNNQHKIFVDGSVDTGDIDENLSDDRIRQIIRDQYLRDTTVTVLLVGTETMKRKHIDWEIYSSMFDGTANKKSGLLVVTLPSTGLNTWYSAHTGEKEIVYPDYTGSWVSLETKAEYLSRYPLMPARIIDNLVSGTAKISVVPWERFTDKPDNTRFLINATFDDRHSAVYDLSQRMRRANS